MIRNTHAATRFTQLFILCFRVITPLSFLYFGTKIAVRDSSVLSLPFFVELYLATEICFYLIIYLPAWRKAQRTGVFGKVLDHSSRRELFENCIRTIPDAEQFTVKWTGAGRLADVGRDDLKDWVRWSMLDKTQPSIEDEVELDGFVQSIEDMLEPQKLKPGTLVAKTNRPSIDEVKILHRPLLYYLCGVAGSDLVSYIWMTWHGFEFYPLRRWFTSVPPRPQTLLCRQRSPAAHTAYWFRPHTSKSRLPILYIHGIGILHTYLKFFSEVADHLDTVTEDGEVGILILDIGPISFRLTHDLPTASEFCEEISRILVKHSYLQSQFLLVANSFGTAVSVQMLKDPAISASIADVIWIDPCVFLLHLPEMTSNFLRREPKSASEWQLWYFASRDIGAAHTLSRRFSWTESIVWKEDLIGEDGAFATRDAGRSGSNDHKESHMNGETVAPQCNGITTSAQDIPQQRRRRWTIVLSENDIIIDAFNVGKYLTRAPGLRAVDDKRNMAQLKNNMTVFDYRQGPNRMKAQVGKESTRDSNLDVLWFEGLNHAEVMDLRSTRRVLIDVVARYSLRTHV